MKMMSADVKSKSKVVGTADYERFDSVAEANDFFGETALLGIINAQHRTNKMNAIRAASNPVTSKKTLRYQVLASLSMEELGSVHGDAAALEALVEQKMDELAVAQEEEEENELNDS